MIGGCLSIKGLKINFLFDLPLQYRLVIAGQPADDLVDFFFCTSLAFRFENVHRIHSRKFHRENSLIILCHSSALPIPASLARSPFRRPLGLREFGFRRRLGCRFRGHGTFGQYWPPRWWRGITTNLACRSRCSMLLGNQHEVTPMLL